MMNTNDFFYCSSLAFAEPKISISSNSVSKRINWINWINSGLISKCRKKCNYVA